MNNEPTRIVRNNDGQPEAATGEQPVAPADADASQTPAAPPPRYPDGPGWLHNGEIPGAEPGPDLPSPAAAAPPPTADPPSPHGIPPGTLLVNTYRVERLLGGGGMGEVYLVRHAKLGTLHAVKVIRSSMAANRQVMDLFYREAKVLRGVRHDAVVSYDGFVQDDQGRDYLVMEYVDGPSLADHLRQGPLAADEVLTLRDQLAAGLAQAHRQGAIHRDISPDNVILPDHRVAAAKLIDFGLSKLTDPTQQTIIGDSFAGKFRFASPEQFGMFGGEVDGRSDIYSLGLILAAAALGRPLDMGNSFDAALRSRQKVPDLTQVPAALRPWMAAMLEPDPARRPATLDELLLRWPASTHIGPRPAGRRHRRAVLVGGAVLVLAMAATAGLYSVLRPLPSPSPPPPPSPSPPPPPPIKDALAPPPPDTLLVKARAALAAFECATLTVTAPNANALTLSGHVQSEADRDRLRDELTALSPQTVNMDQVEVIRWPFCEALKTIEDTASARKDEQAPGIGLDHDNGIYRDYDPVNIDLRSRAGPPGHVLLTTIDSAGRIDHLIPTSTQKDDHIDRTGRRRVAVVAGPPFGRNLMLAVWCEKNLFARPRGDTEPLDTFLRDLAAALQHADPPCGLGYRFWDTREK